MLLVHDLHAVVGEREFEFEDAVREEYTPAVAAVGGRLLHYLHHTHGSGDAYHMVTLTALPDGAAWEQLTTSLRHGDLAPWSARVEAMRYGLTSTLLVQPDWSPLADLELDAIAAVPEDDRAPVLFREDVLTGPGVVQAVAGAAAAAEPAPDDDVMETVAVFLPALATSDDTVRVLYRIPSQERWTVVFAREDPWTDWAGSLTPRLPDGVRISSRMLRTARWSPMI